MFIEFIGCTGAGKSTLIKAVQRQLAETERVTTSYDLVATPLGLRRIAHPTARNIIQEMAGLPFLVPGIYRHKDFVVFTLKMLARQANFTIFTINNLRSLARKIGVHEIVRRQTRDHIVLIDEGTVLLAHNLFVYSEAKYTHEEITRFANLVPLPDVIVYVRAPVDSLVKRTLQRSDPPRELKSKEGSSVEKYIHRAVTMFDHLAESNNIRSRLMVVESPDINDHKYEAMVGDLAAAILNKKTHLYVTRISPHLIS